jgi:IS1 family transposase
MRLMVRVGGQCQKLMDRWMRNLTLDHLQLDEIWTFVMKKEGRIPVDRDNSLIGDQYLFVAIDEETKLIPSYLLGKRVSETTRRFVFDLADRLVRRQTYTAHYRPQISTDGWTPYPRAIEDAFSVGLYHHGVLIKDYRNAEMPGRYAAPEMVGATRTVVHGNIDKRDICTSHVERNNLSIRTFMRRFTRLALGFSKKFANLEAAISLYIAHYNFCRIHGARRMTPAMKAKVVGHPWTLEEMLTEAESE